ncbi:coproporphyrinogen-III oxidase family protein [Desulfamplus magnetovallimortis]|uniref:coproporphyrinogen-III oxidase family protein n=1 Tax=Desulfamplus magnetovallimortis TaxID=1246637 RepID=UPI0016471528|nr:coproporphyrinogen-III oxidase family protein [Desulfamplus magnetovallimortis]
MRNTDGANNTKMSNIITNSIPAGIYIHIPFCARKCPYCDFYSVSELSYLDIFMDALLHELEFRAEPDLNIDTIYIGGGTPSLLSCGQTEKIIAHIIKCFNVMDNPQITMEINPGTLCISDIAQIKQQGFNGHSNKNNYAKALGNGTDTGTTAEITRKLENIRSIGVNRLSIGVQSFQDHKLSFLKRIHSAGTAINTIESARKAGFDNISIDLMYGLPGETQNSWKYDLDVAISMNCEHLSCYMLTYEPGTPMYDEVAGNKFKPLDDEKVSLLFKQTSGYLASHDFYHYEISNFARCMKKKEKELCCQSKHNRKYWNMVPYLGFGPSAHSYDGINRFSNDSSVKTYIARLNRGKLPLKMEEKLTIEQKMIETVMLGLRTAEGINIKNFEHKFNCDFDKLFGTVMERVKSRSWGELCSGKSTYEINHETKGEGIAQEFFHLNVEGWIFLDSVVSWFVDEI